MGATEQLPSAITSKRPDSNLEGLRNSMSHPKFQNDILWDIISGLQPELSVSFRLGAVPQAAICQAFSLKGCYIDAPGLARGK